MIGAMGAPPRIVVLPDPPALAQHAAGLIVQAALDAVAARGRFLLALAGGATPRATYTCLAGPPFAARLPWDRTWVFFGDERRVAPDHRESNYRMAREALLDRVPIPARQVFRLRGEADDSEAAAAADARTLSEVTGVKRGETPRLDLVLLGMGVDGHTASLFPGSPVVREVFRPVAAVHAAAAAIPERLTLTLPVLNAAAAVTFLVEGPEKAKVVKSVLADQELLPAAMVQPTDGTLTWLLDRSAAALLPPGA
jgi:6-phosphogluconolactonase